MEIIIPNWPAPTNVKAFSSTRVGGHSVGEYQGLNLGMHVGDDPKVVEQNRDSLASFAQLPSKPVWLNQTHSTVVAHIESHPNQVIDADGCFTSSTNLVCSAMTADCLPVLLCNTDGTQVAAVHAGWRGLADGIVEKAVKAFSGEVMAWVGPAIGPAAFEVGNDVVEAFTSHDPIASQAFIQRDAEGKWLADMPKLVTQRLNSVGVTQIYQSDLCTYEDAERFYSYRRDGVTGRQTAFIWLES